MNTQLHLEERLHQDINQVRGKVMAMAGLAERAIQVGTRALLAQDRRLAYTVILRDRYIDELETEIDRLCLEFLVRHQPVATHLRFIFAVLHINSELERIGDYAESIGRQVLALKQADLAPVAGKFAGLSELAVRMVIDALQSFQQQDAALAERTIPLEEQANLMRDEINADLAELQRQERLPSAAVPPLVNVARRLERVTDQAKNICEEVLYLCTGEFAKHKENATFRVLFVDQHHAGLAQMAERIASRLQLPGMTFASAGLSPTSPAQPFLDFLVRKEISTSGLVSLGLDQVKDWDHYPVIVALGREVRERLPKRPHKAVCFTWSVPDPLADIGAGQPALPAMEAAYDFLLANVRDLVSAVSEEPGN